ncbi:MAG: lectin-like protein [Bacteroidia bacterium]
MKKYSLLCFLLFVGGASLLAQLPQSLSYQGVVRDEFGEPLSQTLVSFEFSILADSSAGTVFYREEFMGVMTDSFGFVNLQLGTGDPQTTPNLGLVQFSAVKWSGSQRWFEIKLDTDNGVNFLALGSIPINTVPYAFSAEAVIPVYKGPPSISIPNTNATATLNDSWLWEDNQHLYVLFTTSASINWLDAQELARAVGGHLLTLTSPAEDSFVQQNILVGTSITNGEIPLGFTDAVNEGVYQWITGEISLSGRGINYTNWETGEPNDDGGGEDIGEIQIASVNPNRAWNDAPADSKRYEAVIIEISYLIRP